MIAVLIAHSATVISPGSKVLVVGSGPVCLCAAKLAAVRGFSTTCLVPPGDCELGPGLVSEGGDLGSLPLTFMPVAGPEASEEAIEAAAASAEGLILAIDNEGAFGKPVLETFLQPNSALKRVAVMSRYLNGEGMGFFASAAKTAANKDVWAANAQAVASYKAMEADVARMSGAAGVEWTVIRAGTLKGGGSGCSGEEGDERSVGQAFAAAPPPPRRTLREASRNTFSIGRAVAPHAGLLRARPTGHCQLAGCASTARRSNVFARVFTRRH